MFKLKSLLTLVVAIWSLAFLFLYLLLPNWETRGQFGDLFGAVNALFSGLAFASLIYTIQLQKQVLELQRRELQLQREEMKASRDEQAKSAQAQVDLVSKQLLTGRIYGVSAIVQGRYQLASAFGVNALHNSDGALIAEKELLRLLEEAGHSKIELPRI